MTLDWQKMLTNHAKKIALHAVDATQGEQNPVCQSENIAAGMNLRQVYIPKVQTSDSDLRVCRHDPDLSVWLINGLRALLQGLSETFLWTLQASWGSNEQDVAKVTKTTASRTLIPPPLGLYLLVGAMEAVEGFFKLLEPKDT